MSLQIMKDFIFDEDIVTKKVNQYKRCIEDKIKRGEIPHNKRYKQSFFFPTRPMKCMNIMELDEVQPIIARSSWETLFFSWCDKTDSVFRWGSEIVKILYKNPLTNKQSFYIPDVYIELIDKNKQVKKILAEIKPIKESSLKHSSNGYDKLMVAKNACKWMSAHALCNKRGISFQIIHEGDLGLLI